MKAQTSKRIEWEELVLAEIERCGICRSDAQSIVEVKPQLLDTLYDAGFSPLDAAQRFIE